MNPSGKLPDALVAARGDYPDAPNFPGRNGEVNFAEGIYVGYRHFDTEGIEPLFPFGYGLSCTTFSYGHLRLSPASLTPGGNLSVDVTNTGERAGEETAQLYVHERQPPVDRPVRELKGFAKVALLPGETKTVQLEAPFTEPVYHE